MSVAQVAQRYASALYDVAKEKDSVIEYRNLLASVCEQLTEQLESLANSPITSQVSFKEMLKTSLLNAIPEKELQSFFLVLVDNGRLSILNEIKDAFVKIADQDAGVLRGEVRSSRALEETEITKMQSAVEETLERKVILDFVVDPELIGGFEVNVGGYQFVDSIKGHLTKLNEVVKRSAN